MKAIRFITVTLMTIFITSAFNPSESFTQGNFTKNDDGIICFTDVISTTDSLTEDQIYKNFKEWILTKSSNFNRSNSEKNAQGTDVWLGTQRENFVQVDALFKNDNPLKLDDKESKKLVVKIVNKYTGGTMGCLRIVYFEYDLIIKIKEGKYKYDITNFTYTHYNQASAKQTQIYGMKDDGPCKSKGDLDELIKCERCPNEFEKMYTYLGGDISEFIDDMKKSVDIKPEDENW